jgi:WD40 repeat protein
MIVGANILPRSPIVSSEAQMPTSDRSSIRHLYAPYDGLRITGAEFECTVYVWDFKARKRVSVFETPLDFGGRRLAINPRGDICAVASYTWGGLACYAASSGEVICVRDDLKKPQVVVYSPDGKLLYCGCEQGPMTVLDADTGADLAKYPSVDEVFCSAFQSIELLSKRHKGPVELRVLGGKRIATLARITFAILDVAFSPDRFCLTESGGPVRCLGTETGEEIWRFNPRSNRHFLTLTYTPAAKAFFGVEWPYMYGGAKRLFRFDAEVGKPTLIATIKKRCAEQVFCSRGEALLTTEGELIDVLTGVSTNAFRFPKYRRAE